MRERPPRDRREQSSDVEISRKKWLQSLGYLKHPLLITLATVTVIGTAICATSSLELAAVYLLFSLSLMSACIMVLQVRSCLKAGEAVSVGRFSIELHRRDENPIFFWSAIVSGIFDCLMATAFFAGIGAVILLH